MFRIYFSSGLRAGGDYYLEVDCKTLDEVEDIALLECRQRLNSSTLLLHYIAGLFYEVMDGFESKGCLKIRSL